MIEARQLADLGLSENEARVYLALLESNEASISKIAEDAQVHRVTCYDVLEYLRRKGLVLKIEKNKKIYYRANSPKYLVRWSDKQQQQANRRAELARTLFPGLEYLYSANVKKPNIYYYEGLEGIKEILAQTARPNIYEICIYSSPSVFADFLDARYLRNFAAKKKQLRILHKVFVPKEAFAANQEYVKKYYADAKGLIETRVLDIAPIIKNEIQLFKNRIAMLNFTPNNLFGAVVESKDLYEMQTAIFKSLWRKSKAGIQ